MHTCIPSPSRPNTLVPFQIYDDSMPPLLNSPSPFIPYTWQVLLAQYPGDLPSTLLKIIQFSILVGYEGPEKLITSENQQSVNLAPEIFDAQV